MGQVTIDPRVGAFGGRANDVHDIGDALRAAGCPVTTATLAAGDIAWDGVGPASEANRPIFCGAEIKAIGDLLSCITSGRFASSQLPGMLDAYEVNYLIIVGPYRPGQDGSLEVPRGGGWHPAKLGNRSYRYSSLEHWIDTMEECCGLRIRRVYDKRELVELVHSLWAWWELGVDHHKAHKAIFKGKQPTRTAAGYAPLARPSVMRMVLMQLPGVSEVLSERIEEHCQKEHMGLQDLLLLTAKGWQEIPGIGTKLASRMVGTMKELCDDGE